MTTPLLLCTDLDRTLLPNGVEPESPDARWRFTHLVEQPEVILVFVSGRDRRLVQEAIKNYLLPRPDFVISNVGSTIYDLRQGAWQLWSHWQEEIAPDWNGLDHQALRLLLSDLDNLRLQEHSKQNRYKLSYYLPLHLEQQSLVKKIEARFQQYGVAANLILSVDEPAGVGLLDILPRRASKLHAVEFLQDYLGIPRHQTLFAGDSGNDLPVLASPIPSVLVANAMPSVVEDAIATSRINGTLPALYLASGGLFGMNGNYSAGILEGVAHFHPELQPLIEGVESHL